jgi:hypothetical protein
MQIIGIEIPFFAKQRPEELRIAELRDCEILRPLVRHTGNFAIPHFRDSAIALGCGRRNRTSISAFRAQRVASYTIPQEDCQLSIADCRFRLWEFYLGSCVLGL